MKLSRTEVRVLARIKSTYPIVLEAEEKQIVAIGERPLETQNSLAHRFFDGDENKCAAATKNLVAYQCVRIVHLHAPEDFKDIDRGSSRIRITYLKPPTGIDGYQISQHGDKFLASRLINRLQSFAGKIVSKFIDSFIP